MLRCADMDAITHGVTRKRHPCGIAPMFGAALFLGIALAFVPYGVVNSANSYNVVRSEAHAATVVYDPIGLITKMAEAAGLTESQFVATVIGIASSASGNNLVNSQGVSLGESLQNNLVGLIQTADYPDYDLLPDEEKQGWGNVDNYNAAKFNALCKAIGMDQAVDGWYSSGGNSIDFNENEIRILDHIGIIGQTWLNRGSALLSDIKQPINVAGVQSFAGTQYGIVHYDGDEWPSSVPRDLKIGIGNECRLTGNYYSTICRTNQVTYWIAGYSGTSGVWMPFSSNYFNWAASYSTSPSEPTNINRAPYTGTLTQFNYSYYTAGGAGGGFNGIKSCNMPYNDLSSSNVTDIDKACGLILYAESQGNGPEFNYKKIPEYPIGDSGDTTINVYFPTGEQENPETGEDEKKPLILPDTTWPQYTDPPGWEPEPEPDPVRPRPDNPYNPQNPDPDTGDPTTGTDTPEWREETEENVLPLLDIRFDRLFPFSMLFDITRLFDKVENMTRLESSSGVYNVISLPFIWSGDDGSTLVLDLTMLHDLLLMVRIFNQLLLAAFLLFTCIEFWRGILTG